jgi:hypothetical protein
MSQLPSNVSFALHFGDINKSDNKNSFQQSIIVLKCSVTDAGIKSGDIKGVWVCIVVPNLIPTLAWGHVYSK